MTALLTILCFATFAAFSLYEFILHDRYGAVAWLWLFVIMCDRLNDHTKNREHK